MDKNDNITHNIICNNCIGARLYEVSREQFPNPFMWSAIQCDDFVKLINLWDTLNLSDVKFNLEKYKSNEHTSVLVKIQNEINIHFVHYIKDDNKKTPTKELSTNILYYDIINYTRKKWFDRLERIITPPTFLYPFNYANKSDINQYKKDLLKILSTKTDKPIIILIHKHLNLKYNTTARNIKIIECDDKIMDLNGSKLALSVKKILNL